MLDVISFATSAVWPLVHSETILRLGLHASWRVAPLSASYSPMLGQAVAPSLAGSEVGLKGMKVVSGRGFEGNCWPLKGAQWHLAGIKNTRSCFSCGRTTLTNRQGGELGGWLWGLVDQRIFNAKAQEHTHDVFMAVPLRS